MAKNYNGMHKEVTSVLNPVMSSRNEGSRIHLNFVKVFLTIKFECHKEGLMEQRRFIWSTPLLTLNHKLYDMWRSQDLDLHHNFRTVACRLLWVGRKIM